MTEPELDQIYDELAEEICVPGADWDLSSAPQFADELIRAAESRPQTEETEPAETGPDTEPGR